MCIEAFIDQIYIKIEEQIQERYKYVVKYGQGTHLGLDGFYIALFILELEL